MFPEEKSSRKRDDGDRPIVMIYKGKGYTLMTKKIDRLYGDDIPEATKIIDVNLYGQVNRAIERVDR